MFQELYRLSTGIGHYKHDLTRDRFIILTAVEYLAASNCWNTNAPLACEYFNGLCYHKKTEHFSWFSHLLTFPVPSRPSHGFLHRKDNAILSRTASQRTHQSQNVLFPAANKRISVIDLKYYYTCVRKTIVVEELFKQHKAHIGTWSYIQQNFVSV